MAGIVGPLLFTQVFAFAVEGKRRSTLPRAPYLLAAVLVALALGLTARVPVGDGGGGGA